MGELGQQHEPLQDGPQGARWLQMVNAVKANLVPIVLTAVGVVSTPFMTAAAEAKGRTAPIHHFVDYNQGDWGDRYATSGCGPTSAAMVAATETGDPRITPHTIGHQLTPDYWAYNSGTRPAGFHAVAKRYGLDEEPSNLQDAKEVLREGGLAIVHAKPGHFTSAGHYMVLKSLYHGRFRIADPNGAPGRDSEHRWWAPSTLKADGIDDVWTFLPPQAKEPVAQQVGAGHAAS
jgi:peptidase C39-like protein